MLGFRGHFSTKCSSWNNLPAPGCLTRAGCAWIANLFPDVSKSRAYSITLGALRADRAAHQREYAIAAGLQPDLDSDTTLVLTDWRFAGRGHPLMAALAADIASHVSSLPPTGGPPCPGSC